MAAKSFTKNCFRISPHRRKRLWLSTVSEALEEAQNAALPKSSAVLRVLSGITPRDSLEKGHALPREAARGFAAGTGWPRGGRPPPAPALGPRLPRPRPSALAKARHLGWPRKAAPGTAGAGRQSRAAEGVRTPASLRPPGSRLLVPPRGPKTAGAAAPVAAAACSWRARAAAAAASSTSTVRCLGLPGVSAGLWHGLHRTRRGGSHSSSTAQAGSDPTHGARTAGRVASYYGGRFGLTSSGPLPPAPSTQPPDGAAAQARRRPCQTCVCRGCMQHPDSPNGSQDQVLSSYGLNSEGKASFSQQILIMQAFDVSM
ncbi:translation initiation factor IF-2-like [Canis lupus familiaris]|uniref:translation initiation factor IF-2-like n=1 Tax=Canis lupus familiaris TaxID=9615 RepID=UPI0018F7D7F5|nr:translation initiation factor IF-2-like [Canis lupus familiaris]